MGRKTTIHRLTDEQRTTVEENLGLVYKLARKRPQWQCRLQDEEDAIQDAVFGLSRAVQLHDEEGTGSFANYTATAIKNRLNTAAKRQSLIRYHNDEGGEQRYEPPLPLFIRDHRGKEFCWVDLPEREAPPDEAAHHGDLAGILAVLVDRLPECEAKIIRLHFWDGLSFAEIGRQMGMHRRWVNYLYWRGIGTLRRLAEGRGV